MIRSRPARSVSATGLILSILLAGCSSGGSGGVVDPPVDIVGEFALDVVAQDGCGFGAEDVMTAMDVGNVTLTAADVDIPDAEGECSPRTFDRDGAVLTAHRESMLTVGSCDMDVVIDTMFTFEADGSVEGIETNRLTQSGGDCSGLTLPCEILLTATGQLCQGCFDCVEPTTMPSRSLGVLADAARR